MKVVHSSFSISKQRPIRLTSKSIAVLLVLILFMTCIQDNQSRQGVAREEAVRVRTDDSRNFISGNPIPNENYCDQPYVVITRNGNWLCTLTTGRDVEGKSGQHIVATISTDQGRTWSELIDIEPATGPEASWVVPIMVPSGRVYVFYTYNDQNLRVVKNHEGKPYKRVDTLGKMMFKYSDDNGRTWSRERYEVPMRVTQIDRDNIYGGEIQFFWGIDKPMFHDGIFYMGFSKVGNFGRGVMKSSEGYFIRSDNILTEMDPEKIKFDMLPDGELGLKALEGPVADEHNVVALSNGDLYCVYRTVMGHPMQGYSRDGGHTWTTGIMEYSPGGRKIKHPRACPMLWKTHDGKFLFWYHNNGTKWYNNRATAGNRNIAWVTGGIEKNGYIYWSQPEIVVYEDHHFNGASYPDLIEADGKYFITATQKTDARCLEIDPQLIEGLWSQGTVEEVAQEGMVLDLSADQCASGATAPAPQIDPLLGAIKKREMPLVKRGSFTIEFWIRFDDLTPGQIILDGMDTAGKGYLLETTHRKTIRFVMNDGWASASWETDAGILKPGKLHHVVVIIDGGPKIISYVVDGILCDGGEERPFGWGRFRPTMKDVAGGEQLTIAPSLHGKIEKLRMYNRYLRTSEAVGNFRSGL